MFPVVLSGILYYMMSGNERDLVDNYRAKFRFTFPFLYHPLAHCQLSNFKHFKSLTIWRYLTWSNSLNSSLDNHLNANDFCLYIHRSIFGKITDMYRFTSNNFIVPPGYLKYVECFRFTVIGTARSRWKYWTKANSRWKSSGKYLALPPDDSPIAFRNNWRRFIW